MNMIKRLLDKGVQLALGCIGIIFVAGIPILLQDIGHWNLEWKAYWSETKNVFSSLQNPNELTYFSIKCLRKGLYFHF
ncbi:hypothetical protein [Bacillus coahuilensis]|uniref:hypothetical protein n=1 Tax=Bacillus coahuilensis TaxID=408580 RepID=UPI000185069D|nr:hypothetical protein [Bacillus coahuilensis]